MLGLIDYDGDGQANILGSPGGTVVSDVETEGKVTPVKVGVMQVWQKEAGGWKLYARQAFRLPDPK